MKILVTGGAGFIGSAFIRYVLANSQDEIFNLDALTYAGNLDSLPISDSDAHRYQFARINICDAAAVIAAVYQFKPDYVINFAAESHVDRSITGPADFIQTNVLGVFTLLEACRGYWQGLMPEKKAKFRFLQVSTDEVFGDLPLDMPPFNESSPFDPSSPYSASKAAADHLVSAWYRTYGLPVLSTFCSNNYGPYQFPEKLIPRLLTCALKGDPLPVYGDGGQIRDWLYVVDHVEALYEVLTHAPAGERFAIGGGNEKTNLEVVNILCDLLEELAPNKPKGIRHYRDLICFVDDRPGHDRRYAIDSSKIEQWRGKNSKVDFHTGVRSTVAWYLSNSDWCDRVLSKEYLMNNDKI